MSWHGLVGLEIYGYSNRGPPDKQDSFTRARGVHRHVALVHTTQKKTPQGLAILKSIRLRQPECCFHQKLERFRKRFVTWLGRLGTTKVRRDAFPASLYFPQQKIRNAQKRSIKVQPPASLSSEQYSISRGFRKQVREPNMCALAVLQHASKSKTTPLLGIL